MSTQTLAPTSKAEDWRYADQAAVAQLWPVAAEQIAVASGDSRALSIIAREGEHHAREIAIDLADYATMDLRILNAGGAYGRVAVSVRLGRGASFTLGAAQVAGAGATLEIVTTVTHTAPDAISRQLIRSVAGAGATVSYLGRVAVEQGADGTDGEQSVRAMLLDRSAQANARPELEIYADDVKCAHGCAVGELDANALFYLAQRGLPPAAAKALMLQAFVAEAFDGAQDEDQLRALAQAALEAVL
ncbi:SufD family Fe-S cluster assembly protein [Novosphingobium sp. FSY-8]|uniref:SufD family Fe-S cluster assembly protein n=1 Tax=Novosphingobium ovatum TaxID=1908523 RepID=A0ABW9XEN2_9SPHN|nr:SufD family Fe-S cluster assembly protein [Novosphingobium ovatum]NBC37008.1 SufD family Fe-S cluster assembly protein [Novosphingobium ovatum]